MVGVQARAIAVTATVVLGVVINLVANFMTNHFSWSLMIALVAASLSLIGAELRPLLVADWAPHPDEGDKLLFVFDGGRLTAEKLGAIRL
jgi:hypothetical protein